MTSLSDVKTEVASIPLVGPLGIEDDCVPLGVDRYPNG
jgi:hypothetical protein